MLTIVNSLDMWHKVHDNISVGDVILVESKNFRYAAKLGVKEPMTLRFIMIWSDRNGPSWATGCEFNVPIYDGHVCIDTITVVNYNE